MDKLIEKILHLNEITYKKLTKSESGFSNLVFFVDDNYVIKILESNGNKKKFLNEIGFYNNYHFEFIPKYIASGNIDNTHYLIIEKLEGKSLYEIWHNISISERDNITKQIATILKKINKQEEYKFLNKKHIRNNSIKLWQNAFRVNIDILNEKGYETSLLSRYMKNNIPIIFKEEKLGLVYNDAHFDNFIYDGEKVKLIDFDRVLYCSIDYELLILGTMVKNPQKFANETMEPYVNIEDYKEILPIIKSEYPELFDFDYLEDRLFIYSFFYQLSNAYTFNLEQLIQQSIDEFKQRFQD